MVSKGCVSLVGARHSVPLRAKKVVLLEPTGHGMPCPYVRKVVLLEPHWARHAVPLPAKKVVLLEPHWARHAVPLPAKKVVLLEPTGHGTPCPYGTRLNRTTSPWR